MKIVVHPDFSGLTDFIAELPQRFENEGEVVYTGRNILKKYQVNGYDIVVKRFRKPNIVNKIIYDNFRASKARRSYEFAGKLLSLGISTPLPIAFIEDKKFGIFRFSYFVSVFDSTASHVRKEMLGETDDFFLEKLAAFIADIHAKGVLFLDMSPGNILYHRNESDIDFLLVDINRMIFRKRIGFRQRAKNLERLARNMDVLKRLATFYAEHTEFDNESLIDEIMRYSQRFFHLKV